MPKTAPKIKIENTKKYGAEVILYDTYFQSREEIGNEIQKKDNRALIKPVSYTHLTLPTIDRV